MATLIFVSKLTIIDRSARSVHSWSTVENQLSQYHTYLLLEVGRIVKLGLVSLNNLTLNFNDLFAFKGEMRHSSNVFFDKELLQALKMILILGTKKY